MARGSPALDGPRLSVPGRFTDAELEAAVERLSSAERMREAEEVVASAAPALQRVLAEALASGGWFEDSHQSALLRAAELPEEERVTALKTLVAEETRIAMMIGVAVGWALAGELQPPGDEEE
jgi:hypothetical protein